MKKHLYSFLFIFLLVPSIFASHYMGGELRWECTANGNFKFIMKVYRECAGINYPVDAYMHTTVPGFDSIALRRIAQNDISPVCLAGIGPHITCYTTSNPNTGGVEEHIYSSDYAYPNGVPLTGIPPLNGWVFSYKDCCRNSTTNITGSFGMDFLLRSVMYPYNNTNVSTCFDNAPKFDAKASVVNCMGYPFKYNSNASDSDLDSLTFVWAQPLLNTINSPITAFTAGYSYLSPLPGPIVNPNNIPATINPTTGEISFTSYTQGAFQTVMKVSSYRCGIKVSEIFHELQFVLLSCGNNTPPDVTPPFADLSGQYTLFADTVYAGELVSFGLGATDFEFHPTGLPQTMTMEASGSQFATNFISPTACLQPPCATLFPPPPILGQFGAQTTFNWQTDCDHLSYNIGCTTISNTYNFVVETHDDYCPVPASNISTISITVVQPPIIPSPQIRCTEVLQNGDVKLSWNTIEDTMDVFYNYYIYSSDDPNASFIMVDSIFDKTISTYTHINAGANSKPIYYQMRSRSGCDGVLLSDPSITVSTIFLYVDYQSQSNHTELYWTKPQNPLPSFTNGVYKVNTECPFNNWIVLASTTDTTYTDMQSLCNQFTGYRVSLRCTLDFDQFGQPFYCTSISNVSSSVGEDEFFIAGLSLKQNKPNPALSISEIEYSIPSSGFVDFCLTNFLGQIKYQESGYHPGGSHRISLNTENLPSGIYFYSINYQGNQLSKKMIVNH